MGRGLDTIDRMSPQPRPEKAFGRVFAVVFIAAGFYALFAQWGRIAAAGLFAAGVALAVVSALAPRLLGPLTRAWLLLGRALHKIVSPIVLGIIFFGMLTPVACIGCRLGRDELRLKPRKVSTYWIEREATGRASGSFKNQF